MMPVLPLDDDSMQVSKKMLKMWINFAKTGYVIMLCGMYLTALESKFNDLKTTYTQAKTDKF